jgi:hypothetical protein
MIQQRDEHQVRLRPRDDTVYVSHGRTVFATERDGFIDKFHHFMAESAPTSAEIQTLPYQLQ